MTNSNFYSILFIQNIRFHNNYPNMLLCYCCFEKNTQIVFMPACHLVAGWCQDITSVSPVFILGILDCRCAVDRLQTDNGSLLILCTDASGKNTSAGRILEISKGKDYGKL